jgi:hypothetical protein
MAKTDRFCTTCAHWKHTGRFWGDCAELKRLEPDCDNKTAAGSPCIINPSAWKLGDQCIKRGDKMKPAIKWLILAAVAGLSGACGGNMPMDPACAMEAAQECYEAVQGCMESDGETEGTDEAVE